MNGTLAKGEVPYRSGVGVIDNERSQGDHCHLDGQEFPYSFSTVDQLIEDFIKEIDKGALPRLA